MRPNIRRKVVCSTLMVFYVFIPVPAKASSSRFLYGPGPERWVFSPGILIPDRGRLRERGYDVNNVEDLKRAASDAEPVVRKAALHLLSSKVSEQAIPVLRQALNDTWPEVRSAAARLMGVLGDLSGLERMRKDMAELTAQDQSTDSAEEKPTEVPKNQSLYLRSKEGRLLYALEAAQVLAEFGDSSGYRLAAETAIQSKSKLKRNIAMEILAELGRIDKATLQARGHDPEAVLLVAAETETDAVLLERLSTYAKTRMRPESTIRVLEKLERSPHLSERGRVLVTSRLRDMRKQLERKKQAGEQKKE